MPAPSRLKEPQASSVSLTLLQVPCSLTKQAVAFSYPRLSITSATSQSETEMTKGSCYIAMGEVLGIPEHSAVRGWGLHITRCSQAYPFCLHFRFKMRTTRKDAIPAGTWVVPYIHTYIQNLGFMRDLSSS